MPWDEKDVYEHKMAQTRAWFTGSIVFIVAAALVAIAFIFLSRPVPPPEKRMTAEDCKTICGEPGVISFKDEDCECRRPEKTRLNCTCE